MADEVDFFGTLVDAVFEPATDATFTDALTSKQLIACFEDSMPDVITYEHVYNVLTEKGFIIKFPPGEKEAKWLLKEKKI